MPQRVGLAFTYSDNGFRTTPADGYCVRRRTTPRLPLRSFERRRLQDGCAEMLATIRRGPGSPPTDDELIEYLITRKPHNQERPPAETGGVWHVRASA